jgi:hypothetical protein
MRLSCRCAHTVVWPLAPFAAAVAAAWATGGWLAVPCACCGWLQGSQSVGNLLCEPVWTSQSLSVHHNPHAACLAYCSGKDCQLAHWRAGHKTACKPAPPSGEGPASIALPAHNELTPRPLKASGSSLEAMRRMHGRVLAGATTS